MARKRMIDPKFWTDDKIIELDPLCRLLFIGIWNFADDSGIHLNNSKVLKAEVFPADDIPVTEVQEMKDKLLELGMIEISDNKKLFRIRNWEVYQKINRPQPSNYQFSEHSVNDHTLFIGKEREGKVIEDKVIKKKVNKVQKVKKPSTLKPYKERVEDFFDNIEPDFRKLLEDAYPNIDIDRELIKSRTWLLVNTNKAKKQFKKFVNNWMSSAMENAGRYNKGASEERMMKLNEERIERERRRRTRYQAEYDKNQASPSDIKEALGDFLKKGKKDVTSDKD